ncbi:MAG: hypothetical protein ABI689_05695 [Thermoanaerobaculia bacterium]
MSELPDLEADLAARGVSGRAVRSALLALALIAGTAPAHAALQPPPEQGEPPLGRAVVPPLPLPALPPDPGRLAKARALLVPPLDESAICGYRLLTDIADPALSARVAALVGGLEAIYVERYGRVPVGRPREAIVLFATEEGYRRYQAVDPRLAGLTSSTGLAGKGVVATFRGARSDDELLGTLAHELGHLLNRRALGPSLPSWLDEGIADDLGASRIDRQGNLLPGSWSRTLTVRGPEIRISGGEAALRDLADIFGPDGNVPGRLDLGEVLALDWEEFVAEESAELHYAAAAAFIRMLLAAPARRDRFLGWLAEVAAGASPAAEELRRRLDRSWDELGRDLVLWTRAELARLPQLQPGAHRAGRPASAS